MQILIDFAVRPQQAQDLWTPLAVETFLRRAVEVTGLHAISPLQVLEHDGHIDGHVTIAESHIHVTLRPAVGRGFVDVFSCRYVAAGKIELALEETLLPPGAMVYVDILPRGDLPPQEEAS
jgi:S-adenosylmethionine/arginine decarboxylase-like enzyme